MIIYIRVLLSVVIPPTMMDLFPSTRHFYLIEGSMEEFERYAGTTVDWIIKVAHSICDPSGTLTLAGQVYTHTVGIQYHWRQVVLGDPLLPGIYEFVTMHPITLSKISERDTHSMTSISSELSAATFRSHLTYVTADAS